MGGPDGIAIKNLISTQIAFSQPVIFDAAFVRLLALLRYYELLIGRQQNVVDIGIVIGSGDEHDQYLKVDWSHSPTRETRTKERAPHPTDVLIDAIRDPAVFSGVLTRWFERQDTWIAPRLRFSGSFNRRVHYDIDRVIATANMFDILPDSAFPPIAALTPELLAAKAKAKEVFDGLPQSFDRDSILNALGRLGKLSLKKKIAARVGIINRALGARLPDLDFVTEEAVNCRNYFVHGGKQKFEYAKNWRVIGFFVDTLEFVFGASDLIEAGWDAASWMSKGTVMSHPFAEFKIEYLANLKRLRETIEAAKDRR